LKKKDADNWKIVYAVGVFILAVVGLINTFGAAAEWVENGSLLMEHGEDGEFGLLLSVWGMLVMVFSMLMVLASIVLSVKNYDENEGSEDKEE